MRSVTKERLTVLVGCAVVSTVIVGVTALVAIYECEYHSLQIALLAMTEVVVVLATVARLFCSCPNCASSESSERAEDVP